jgi:hypothetical protein
MDFVRALFSAGSTPAQTVVAPNVEENPARYCPGGYHPVAIGDVYQCRYQVMRSSVSVGTRLYGLHKRFLVSALTS